MIIPSNSSINYLCGVIAACFAYRIFINDNTEKETVFKKYTILTFFNSFHMESLPLK